MKYDTLANTQTVKKITIALKEKGYEVAVVKNKQEALAHIKKTIPQGATVMNGSSVTLEQIGYSDYLKSGTHGWKDLHAEIAAENEPQRRAALRRQSVSSEYYLGSVHAVVENGEFVIASNTGSQLPHVVFTSPHLIFVVSTKKIVPTLDAAMKRLEEHVIPLEDKHMQKLYQIHTKLNKLLIFKGEAKMIGRTIQFILVEEDLGF